MKPCARPWEGSTADPASIRSPHPHTQDRKPRKALLDRQGMGSGCGSVPTEPKGFEVPKHPL
jgi:hypothetical protein